MKLKIRDIIFMIAYHVLMQVSLQASALWQDIPQDIVGVIASHTRIKDGVIASQVSKAWQRSWNDSRIWRDYTRRIPGYERVEERIRLENLQNPLNYKAILQELMKPKFTILKSLNKARKSQVQAVSADGSTIVGFAQEGRTKNKIRAFVWTEKEGMRSIGTLYKESNSKAYAVNANGKIIVGEAYNDHGLPVAFIWTEQKGMRPLETISKARGNYARAINGNGKIVIGYCHEDQGESIYNVRACAWLKERGMEALGTLYEGHNSYTTAISMDGKVIVGYAHGNKDNPGDQAFIWTQEVGMQPLGWLEGKLSTYAQAINETGDIIVGNAHKGHGFSWEAFIWTKQEGIKALNAFKQGRVKAMSGDGKIIVGYGSDAQGHNACEASMWIEGTLFSLEKIFNQALPQGYILQTPQGISADGTIIVGNSNRGSAWRVYIPRFDVFKKEGFKLIEKN